MGHKRNMTMVVVVWFLQPRFKQQIKLNVQQN